MKTQKNAKDRSNPPAHVGRPFSSVHLLHSVRLAQHLRSTFNINLKEFTRPCSPFRQETQRVTRLPNRVSETWTCLPNIKSKPLKGKPSNTVS